MKIFLEVQGGFLALEKKISQMVEQGYKSIMVLHAEGGIDSQFNYKEASDKALGVANKNGVHIFGGIFPGIFCDGKLMSKGSILAGMKSKVHVITLESLEKKIAQQTLDAGIKPIQAELENQAFKTAFVFGDGFGENNLALINGLNRMVQKYPINVIGGLTGRDQLKAAHYSIFTPEKIIQNGAVIAFTKFESGIGVRHGWEPLMDSAIEVTRINGCFVEEINGVPALDFYMHVISSYDKQIDKDNDLLLKDTDRFFNEVAIKYPLGLIRKGQGEQRYIDRTAVSVGGDRSLQFSAEIPVGTKACILTLKGDSANHQCLNLSKAVQDAYKDGQRRFKGDLDQSRVIIMDCFGRKKMVENLGKDFNKIEFSAIAQDQKKMNHSPIGPLTFGEISSVEGNYVELHNKTAVVGIISS